MLSTRRFRSCCITLTVLLSSLLTLSRVSLVPSPHLPPTCFLSHLLLCCSTPDSPAPVDCVWNRREREVWEILLKEKYKRFNEWTLTFILMFKYFLCFVLGNWGCQINDLWLESTMLQFTIIKWEGKFTMEEVIHSSRDQDILFFPSAAFAVFTAFAVSPFY